MEILKRRFVGLDTHAHDKALTLSMAVQCQNLMEIFRQELTRTTQVQLQGLQNSMHVVRLDGSSCQDEVIWKWTSDGKFSVKTTYYTMKDGPMIRNIYNTIWSLRAPARFKVFGWLTTLNRILTIDNLD
jgi:hypothetical protein